MPCSFCKDILVFENQPFQEKNVLQTEMPGLPKQNRPLQSIQPGKEQSQPKVAKVPMQDLMQMFDILDVGETLMKMGAVWL